MPYIGVSPQFGVRRKHTYTATAGQTSFSGAGSEGATLSYTDSNFVDVYQNGVKLGDADYTSTSGTAIVLAQGASVNDLVEIIVFDAFSAADTVSKADGGTFDGAVTFGGGVSGVLDADDGITVDNITIDGTEIDLSSGDLTLDVAGDIILDADGGDITIKDGGTTVGNIGNDSTDLYIAGTTHGLKFDSIDASTMYIRPVNNSGSNVTGQIDLGQSGNVFRDAYVSGGVYFAPHSYPANYLDDYEEGTWTPTADGGSTTYHDQYGFYTKIGRLVYAKFNIRINSYAGSTGYVMGGLPFTSMNVTGSGGSGSIFYFGNIANNAIFMGARVDPNVSAIYISASFSASTNMGNINHNWAGNNAQLIGHVIYHTA